MYFIRDHWTTLLAFAVTILGGTVFALATGTFDPVKVSTQPRNSAPDFAEPQTQPPRASTNNAGPDPNDVPETARPVAEADNVIPNAATLLTKADRSSAQYANAVRESLETVADPSLALPAMKVWNSMPNGWKRSSGAPGVLASTTASNGAAVAFISVPLDTAASDASLARRLVADLVASETAGGQVERATLFDQPAALIRSNQTCAESPCAIDIYVTKYQTSWFAAIALTTGSNTTRLRSEAQSIIATITPR